MQPNPMPRPSGSRRSRAALAALLLAVAMTPHPAAGIAAAERAHPVSPGALDRPTDAASPCPTFSWAGAAGASGYELVVLAVDAGAEPQVVLRETIDGGALGWTPDRSRCLAPGAYAWSVRALATVDGPAADAAAWAPVRRFSVAALPSSAEVATALETLRRWQAGQTGQTAGTFAEMAAGNADAPARPAPVARAAEANVSGTAAIRGEMPGASGETYGVAGVSASPQGAGLAAVNTGGGADLVLDGTAQGQADTRLFHDALDRPSGNPESFDFRNSGAGRDDAPRRRRRRRHHRHRPGQPRRALVRQRSGSEARRRRLELRRRLRHPGQPPLPDRPNRQGRPRRRLGLRPRRHRQRRHLVHLPRRLRRARRQPAGQPRRHRQPRHAAGRRRADRGRRADRQPQGAAPFHHPVQPHPGRPGPPGPAGPGSPPTAAGRAAPAQPLRRRSVDRQGRRADARRPRGPGIDRQHHGDLPAQRRRPGRRPGRRLAGALRQRLL